MCIFSRQHFRFLVQEKTNLDKKFEKMLVKLGGCPPDPLQFDRKQTPRTVHEHSSRFVRRKNRVDTASGFSNLGRRSPPRAKKCQNIQKFLGPLSKGAGA